MGVAPQSIVSRIAHETLRQSSAEGRSGRWWSQLEEDFYEHPEHFTLGLYDDSRIRMTGMVDMAVRTFGAIGVGLTAFPLGFRPSKLREMEVHRKFYEPIAETGNPNVFFAPPPETIEVGVQAPTWPYYDPYEGACIDFNFESSYEPFNTRFRKEYLRSKRNRIAHARYWRHESGPRPTVIMIHGFGAESYWLNEWFMGIRQIYEVGCDVLAVTLPFHGPRQNRFSPFSGSGFFAGGLPGINEAFGHAIFDIRCFMNVLEEEFGVTSMGVAGVSLGGYVSALLASVESRLQFCVPIVPVASIADLALEGEPLGTVIRHLFKHTDHNLEEMRRILAVTSPLSYQPVIAPERLFVIGGAGDRLVPPKHTRLLWEHWRECRIHWFPGGHLLHLDREDYMREFERFIMEIGFM